MKLIQESITILADTEYFLERITPTEYSMPIPILSDSTIGQHTRHFIEFYLCLLQQAEHKKINYCLRKRDQLIETSPAFAIDSILKIKLGLTKLNLEDIVTVFTAKENGNAFMSTLGRELYYNMEHCLHHLAMIKIGLKVIRPNLELPPHFGVAASTCLHRKHTA